MIRWLACALIVLACLAVAADGQCVVRRRVALRSAAVGYRQAAALVAVEAVPVAVPVFVPTYTASYYGDSTQELVQKVARLEAQVELLTRLRQAPAPAPAQAAPKMPAAPQEKDDEAEAPADPAALARVPLARCAACHDAGTKTKGGGFVLVSKGALAPLSADQRLEVLRRVNLPAGEAEHMPRGGDLSDAEFAELMAVLVQRPAAAVPKK